jgi:2-polyprenyl-3-methyl-5-hydroxy-6-metoxy-1,4-benzoquinol methylase
LGRRLTFQVSTNTPKKSRSITGPHKNNFIFYMPLHFARLRCESSEQQDIHARLLADPPARIADIGCGGGWSSIAINDRK